MNTAATRCQLFELINNWRPPVIREPQPSKELEEVVDHLRRKANGAFAGRLPAPVELDETLEAVIQAWRKRGLMELKGLHWRRSPFVLFFGDPPHLGDNRRFLKAYFRAVARRPRSDLILSLVRVYFEHYDPQRPTMRQWRKALQEFMGKSNRRQVAAWKDSSLRFGWFMEDGERLFAQAWINGESRPQEILDESGLLRHGLTSSDFVRSAYRWLLDEARNLLETESWDEGWLDRFLEIPKSDDDETALRFRDMTKETAETLLEPLADRKFPPHVQEKILRFFERTLGHPRVSPHNWSVVSAKAQRVMLGWLVRISLDQFFELISQTIEHHHWEARQSFWRAYLDDGHIEEAWVALGRRARWEVRATANLTEEFAHGRLEGGGADQVLLLMRMSELVIAEWSHNGACRVWHASDARAPELYREAYLADTVRSNAVKEIRHAGSDRGLWQGRLAHYIHQQTGICPAPHAHLVRRYARRYWG